MRNSQGFEFYPGKRLPVVCRDGITRQAVATGYAGHGLPAAVQVTFAGKRRTVSGTVYPLPFSRLLSFYATGRNSDLIGWTNCRPWKAALARRLIAATAYGRSCPGYLWDLPSDHANGLARGCLDYQQGRRTGVLNGTARKLLKNKGPSTVVCLAAYFRRLAAFMEREEA
jgi:hypothetical protein